MGTKTNCMIASLMIFGLLFDSYNLKHLFCTTSMFVFVHKNYKVYRFTVQFPGSHMLLNFMTFLKSTAEKFQHQLFDAWKLYNCDKFVTWIGFERFIVLSKGAEIKVAVNKNGEKDLIENYQHIWPWMGSEVQARTIFNRIVAENVFQQYAVGDYFLTKARNHSQDFVTQAESKEDFNVLAQIRLWTFDAIYETATGVSMKLVSDRRALFEAAETLCQLSDQKQFTGYKQHWWLARLGADENKMKQCRQTIAAKALEIMENNNKSINSNYSVLSALLSTQQTSTETVDTPMTNDEIVDAFVDFIVLGYDRLASTIGFALYELAKNPTEQDKLYDELKDYKGDDLNGLNQLECVLRETMRMYPAAGIINRFVKEGIPLFGVFVPPNTNVLYYLFGLGRDPWSFSSPNSFEPSRKVKDLFDGTFTGNSFTMRLMKSLLSTLLTTYTVQLDNPKQEVVLGQGITLRSIEPLKLQLLSRNKQ